MRPHFNVMTGQSRMTIFACIINAATLHLDCDNVQARFVMNAARLVIHINAAHNWTINQHTSRLIAQNRNIHPTAVGLSAFGSSALEKRTESGFKVRIKKTSIAA
jgi:hypothetical protein